MSFAFGNLKGFKSYRLLIPCVVLYSKENKWIQVQSLMAISDVRPSMLLTKFVKQGAVGRYCQEKSGDPSKAKLGAR